MLGSQARKRMYPRGDAQGEKNSALDEENSENERWSRGNENQFRGVKTIHPYKTSEKLPQNKEALGDGARTGYLTKKVMTEGSSAGWVNYTERGKPRDKTKVGCTSLKKQLSSAMVKKKSASPVERGGGVVWFWWWAAATGES